jgi:Cd2+/Zn2+-exporting ATPase
LTKGRPVVTTIVPLALLSAHEILALTAAVESRSEHPLAQAILQYAQEQGVSWSEPMTFEALPGRGARARIDGAEVVVGKPGLFEGVGDDIQARMTALQQAGNTILLVAQAGTLVGLVAVADEVRPMAKQVVSTLKKIGMRSVVMLTGDNERTARAVSHHLGIDEIRANLLPEHKTDAIKELLAHHGAVAMVGDGINDAPALAQATVGIAMGAAGSDTALETADVALMADDLSKLPFLIRLSRATLRTIYTNITFSLVVKAVFLVLTLLGLANLWLAILADTGAALVVIAYGMRLLRFREGKAMVSVDSETV